MKQFSENLWKARHTKNARAAMVAAALAAAVSPVLAADATWDVNAAGDWSLATNWSDDTAPGVADGGLTTTNTDTASFGPTISAARLVTVDDSRNIGSINFAGNSSAYTLGGGSLLLTSGGTLQTSGAGSGHTDVVASAMFLQGNGGTYTFSSNSSTATRILSITGNVTGVAGSGNTTVLTLNGSNTSSSNALSGTLSDGVGGGKLGLTKDGTGSWAISGANSGMSGIVTLNSGVLTAQNLANTNVMQALGTGDLYLNGGTLNLRANGTGSSQVITTGTGLFVGSGTTTIDVNRYNGSTTVNSFAFATSNLGAGTLNVTGGSNYSLRVLGTTTLAANATVNPTTANLAFLGTITDGGTGRSLTKNGTGTLTLSVANSYSGGTTLNAGRLILGNTGALGTGPLVINGGHLDVTSGTTPTLNAGMPITLSGSFTVLSAISTGLNTGASNNITLGNNITISGGTNGYGSTFNLSGAIGDGANTFGITINAGGSNPASVQLSGNNDFGGGVTMNGATLRIANNNALGTGIFTINGGTVTAGINNLALAGISQQIWAGDFGFTNNAGDVNLGSAPVTMQGAVRSININNVGASVSGNISGVGSLLRITTGQYNGSLTLSGNNTFDGGVLVVAGGTGQSNLVAGHSNAFGSGSLMLSSAARSRASLATALTVAAIDSTIAAPTIVAGGSGYVQNSTTVTISGGGGTGATANAVVTGGAITGISITNYGTGYTSTPTFTINGAGINANVTGNFAASSIVLGAHTLTLAGTNANPAAYSGVISGTGHLVKQGSGAQSLTGVNTYSGATTVAGGMLQLAGAGSINAGSGVSINGETAVLMYDSSAALTKAVSFGSGGGSFIYNENATGYSGGDLNVGAGALLGGSGRITNNVTVASGGKLSPGNELGTLTVDGSLNLDGATGDNNGALVFRIGTGGDKVVVGGSLDIGQLDWADLSLSDNGALVNGDYVLIDAASTINGSIGTASGSWGFFTGTLSIDNTNNDVLLTVVPEPASLSLVGLGAAGLLSRRRRRAN